MHAGLEEESNAPEAAASYLFSENSEAASSYYGPMLESSETSDVLKGLPRRGRKHTRVRRIWHVTVEVSGYCIALDDAGTHDADTHVNTTGGDGGETGGDAAPDGCKARGAPVAIPTPSWWALAHQPRPSTRLVRLPSSASNEPSHAAAIRTPERPAESAASRRQSSQRRDTNHSLRPRAPSQPFAQADASPSIHRRRTATTGFHNSSEKPPAALSSNTTAVQSPILAAAMEKGLLRDATVASLLSGKQTQTYVVLELDEWIQAVHNGESDDEELSRPTEKDKCNDDDSDSFNPASPHQTTQRYVNLEKLFSDQPQQSTGHRRGNNQPVPPRTYAVQQVRLRQRREIGDAIVMGSGDANAEEVNRHNSHNSNARYEFVPVPCVVTPPPPPSSNEPDDSESAYRTVFLIPLVAIVRGSGNVTVRSTLVYRQQETMSVDGQRERGLTSPNSENSLGIPPAAATHTAASPSTSTPFLARRRISVASPSIAGQSSHSNLGRSTVKQPRAPSRTEADRRRSRHASVTLPVPQLLVDDRNDDSSSAAVFSRHNGGDRRASIMSASALSMFPPSAVAWDIDAEDPNGSLTRAAASWTAATQHAVEIAALRLPVVLSPTRENVEPTNVLHRVVEGSNACAVVGIEDDIAEEVCAVASIMLADPTVFGTPLGPSSSMGGGAADVAGTANARSGGGMSPRKHQSAGQAPIVATQWPSDASQPFSPSGGHPCHRALLQYLSAVLTDTTPYLARVVARALFSNERVAIEAARCFPQLPTSFRRALRPADCLVMGRVPLLHLGILLDDLSLVDELLNLVGASPSEESSGLVLALRLRRVSVSQRFISRRSVYGRFGTRTPMHEAVALRDLDLVCSFVELGCELNAVDNQGNTPLRLAVAQRREAIMASSPMASVRSPRNWESGSDRSADADSGRAELRIVAALLSSERIAFDASAAPGVAATAVAANRLALFDAIANGDSDVATLMLSYHVLAIEPQLAMPLHVCILLSPKMTPAHQHALIEALSKTCAPDSPALSPMARHPHLTCGRIAAHVAALLPTATLALFVRLHPACAATRDDDGDTPLHLFVKHNTRRNDVAALCQLLSAVVDGSGRHANRGASLRAALTQPDDSPQRKSFLHHAVDNLSPAKDIAPESDIDLTIGRGEGLRKFLSNIVDSLSTLEESCNDILTAVDGDGRSLIYAFVDSAVVGELEASVGVLQACVTFALRVNADSSETVVKLLTRHHVTGLHVLDLAVSKGWLGAVNVIVHAIRASIVSANANAQLVAPCATSLARALLYPDPAVSSKSITVGQRELARKLSMCMIQNLSPLPNVIPSEVSLVATAETSQSVVRAGGECVSMTFLPRHVLHIAVARGYLDVVTALLQHNTCLPTDRDEWGLAALHVCLAQPSCYEGHFPTEFGSVQRDVDTTRMAQLLFDHQLVDDWNERVAFPPSSTGDIVADVATVPLTSGADISKPSNDSVALFARRESRPTATINTRAEEDHDGAGKTSPATNTYDRLMLSCESCCPGLVRHVLKRWVVQHAATPQYSKVTMGDIDLLPPVILMARFRSACENDKDASIKTAPTSLLNRSFVVAQTATADAMPLISRPVDPTTFDPMGRFEEVAQAAATLVLSLPLNDYDVDVVLALLMAFIRNGCVTAVARVLKSEPATHAVRTTSIPQFGTILNVALLMRRPPWMDEGMMGRECRDDVVGHILSARGVPVDHCAPETRETALCIAIRLGHVRIVEDLVTYGADVNSGSADHTPFSTLFEHAPYLPPDALCEMWDALHGCRTGIVRKEHAMEVVGNLFVAAAATGSVPLVRRVVEAGVHGVRSLRGTTLVHEVVRLACLPNTRISLDNLSELIGYAINCGTADDLQKPDAKGFMPLHIACSFANAAVVGILFKFRVAADYLTEQGDTCAHLAVNSVASNWQNIDATLAKLGSRHALTIASRDSSGETLIHLAARKGFVQLLLRLAEHPSVDWNVRTPTGQSAIDLLLSSSNAAATDPANTARLIEIACRRGFLLSQLADSSPVTTAISSPPITRDTTPVLFALSQSRHPALVACVETLLNVTSSNDARAAMLSCASTTDGHIVSTMWRRLKEERNVAAVPLSASFGTIPPRDRDAISSELVALLRTHIQSAVSFAESCGVTLAMVNDIVEGAINAQEWTVAMHAFRCGLLSDAQRQQQQQRLILTTMDSTVAVLIRNGATMSEGAEFVGGASVGALVDLFRYLVRLSDDVAVVGHVLELVFRRLVPVAGVTRASSNVVAFEVVLKMIRATLEGSDISLVVRVATALPPALASPNSRAATISSFRHFQPLPVTYFHAYVHQAKTLPRASSNHDDDIFREAFRSTIDFCRKVFGFELVDEASGACMGAVIDVLFSEDDSMAFMPYVLRCLASCRVPINPDGDNTNHVTLSLNSSHDIETDVFREATKLTPKWISEAVVSFAVSAFPDSSVLRYVTYLASSRMYESDDPNAMIARRFAEWSDRFWVPLRERTAAAGLLESSLSIHRAIVGYPSADVARLRRETLHFFSVLLVNVSDASIDRDIDRDSETQVALLEEMTAFFSGAVGSAAASELVWDLVLRGCPTTAAASAVELILKLHPSVATSAPSQPRSTASTSAPEDVFPSILHATLERVVPQHHRRLVNAVIAAISSEGTRTSLADCVVKSDRKGQTPLMVAAARGNAEFVSTITTRLGLGPQVILAADSNSTGSNALTACFAPCLSPNGPLSFIPCENEACLDLLISVAVKADAPLALVRLLSQRMTAPSQRGDEHVLLAPQDLSELCARFGARSALQKILGRLYGSGTRMNDETASRLLALSMVNVSAPPTNVGLMGHGLKSNSLDVIALIASHCPEKVLRAAPLEALAHATTVDHFCWVAHHRPSAVAAALLCRSNGANRVAHDGTDVHAITHAYVRAEANEHRAAVDLASLSHAGHVHNAADLDKLHLVMNALDSFSVSRRLDILSEALAPAATLVYCYFAYFTRRSFIVVPEPSDAELFSMLPVTLRTFVTRVLKAARQDAWGAWVVLGLSLPPSPLHPINSAQPALTTVVAGASLPGTLSSPPSFPFWDRTVVFYFAVDSNWSTALMDSTTSARSPASPTPPSLLPFSRAVVAALAMAAHASTFRMAAGRGAFPQTRWCCETMVGAAHLHADVSSRLSSMIENRFPLTSGALAAHCAMAASPLSSDLVASSSAMGDTALHLWAMGLGAINPIRADATYPTAALAAQSYPDQQRNLFRRTALDYCPDLFSALALVHARRRKLFAPINVVL